MTNRQTQALAVPIDPEFAAVFEAARRESMGGVSKELPGQSDTLPKTQNPQTPKAAVEEDERFKALEEFAALAEKNRRESIDRKTLEPGSFDQIENDISNTLKLGWDFLTR